MSSRQSVLLVVGCLLQALPFSISCSDNGQPGGAAGAGTSGSNAESGGAHAQAGSSAVPAGGESGAATGGAEAMGGAATGGAEAMGGTAMGGTAGVGGNAGVPSAGAPTGGRGGMAAGGDSGCSALSQTRSARSGKSAGFSGDYQTKYYPLYSHACNAAADCAAACVTAGGTETSCAASECVDSTPDYCLPPTYWFDFDQLLTEGNSEESSVWLIMVNNPYRDRLEASNFQFEIPAGAKILGISFAINEAAGSADLIADYSVRALANNQTVGLDRGHSTPWTTAFHPEVYGGPADLWGTTWTAEAVNETGFGIALTPRYLDTAGNERAYVDFIRATVTYDICQ